MIFKAYRTDKKLEIEDREKYYLYLASVPIGAQLAIIIDPWDETRSLPSNRLWHEMVHRYTAKTGIAFSHAREELKYQWGVKVEYTPDGWTAPSWSGRFVERDMTLWFLKSTAEYIQREFNALIEGTILTCHENSVDIDDILELK